MKFMWSGDFGALFDPPPARQKDRVLGVNGEMADENPVAQAKASKN
jgi:hypothetical protein